MSRENKNSIYQNVWLYRVTYTARFSFLLVLVLLFSFLLQPIDNAYADEGGEVVAEVMPEPVVDEVDEPELEPEAEVSATEAQPVEDEPVEVSEFVVNDQEEVVESDSEIQITSASDEVAAESGVDITEVETSVDVEEDLELSVENEVYAEDEDDSATSTDVVEVDSSKNVEELSVVETGTSTDEATSNDTLATSTATSTEDVQGEEISETETILDSTTGDVSENDDIALSTIGVTSSSTEVTFDDEVDSDNDESSSTTTNEVTEEVSDNSETEQSNDSEVQTPNDPESDEVVSDIPHTGSSTSTATTSSNVATSSVDLAESLQVANIAVNDTNRHQFSVDECVSVGDGAFYCSEIETVEQHEEDGVFSAPDSDGDMEIFVRIEGEERQITFNAIDDAAPYFDAVSQRIVWHRLLNDRYQIVSMDLDHMEEELITGTSYNNMEPVAFGDFTLWQAWIDNNWEIMRYEDGETTRLTSNTVHDIAPNMRGGYVVWQTQFVEGWKVAVLDQKTDSVEYIETNGATGAVENPRFVLVFDSTDANGDTRTMGYDFDSGSTINLGSLPVELPDELPEPEQTGEEKALIQAKPTTRVIDEEDGDDISAGAVATTSTKAKVATSASDIVITSATTTDDSFGVESEIDLTIETPTTTADVSHIPDVVIPSASSTEQATE